MNKDRRDHLRGVIGRARRLVETTLQQQLNGFGLFSDAEPAGRDELAFSVAQEQVYPRLLDAVRRAGRAMGEGDRVTPDAVVRYVREAGGTWVNRLAALRALEARELLGPAATIVSDEYGGLSPRAYALRERAAADGKPISPDEALRNGLCAACEELAATVRVLFDLSDEQSLLWPDKVALRELLRLLSAEVTEPDWREPDVLGWVYQYYNADANQALKQRKNRTTSFKYRPDDIPIANQFYTPSWVVRALADNTLGRLWLEMRSRLPRHLSDESGWRLEDHRRDVPHAGRDPAGFRVWVGESPDALLDVSIDRLCRFLVPLPSEAPPRPEKSPRELRVLDPACGSGHFLIYAFDLLFAMYREAEPDLDPRSIPALILENNLFGIDIDLRAAQLAAFDLYLKARVTLQAIDPSARLSVRRLNIVVADAHIAGDPRKDSLLARYKDEPEIQDVYRRVLASVDNTNVLGSLLKVRPLVEELFGRVSEARRQRAEAQRKESIAPGQQALLPRSAPQEIREVFRGRSGRAFRIEDLIEDLRRFEEEVLPSQDIGARLFYTDLERTVGLIGLLSQRYDVVLMNPPYGDMPADAKDYAKGNKSKKPPVQAHYPRTHSDYATAFLEQAIDLLAEDGLVGMLVSRSFMHMTSFEDVRTQLLLEESRPELILDLGRGILDRADVRVCAAVVRGIRGDHSASSMVVNRLAYFRDAQRPIRFIETFPVYAATGPGQEIDWFAARLGSLRDVPGMPYAYWASDWLRALFRLYPPLDRDQRGVRIPGRPNVKIGDVKQGLATADDPRFVRFQWEVPPAKIGRHRKWVPFVKGGSQVRFFARTDLVVNWDRNGAEIKEFPKSVVRNESFYFKAGITWPRANWRLRRFGVFPPDCVFADKGPSIFPVSAHPENLLAIIDSALGTIAMLVQTPERMWEVRLAGNLPIAPAALEADVLCATAEPLVALCRAKHEGDETFSGFTGPGLRRLQLEHAVDAPGSLEIDRLLDRWAQERHANRETEDRLISSLDDAVHQIYATPPEDRALIARELARRPKAEGGYSEGEADDGDEELDAEDDVEGEGEVEGDADAETPEIEESPVAERRSLVAAWISYYVKAIVEKDDDGIVPIAPMNREAGLIVRVREAMVRDLGADAAHRIEAQAPAYLGTTDLEEWLSVSREETIPVDGKRKKLPVGFFPWHVERYRTRPPIWMISSENFESGTVRMTFRVLVHFHRLTPDTLRKIRSHYFEEIAKHAQERSDAAKIEATRGEGKAASRAKAAAQEWSNTVSALGQFRGALESVIDGPVHASPVPANARWTARTIAEVRGGREHGHGYQPNIDHGVKVNITPLVEARLLPRVVLARLGG